MRDEEFAADLAGVVNGNAPPEYADPVIFFRHTHPTRGLRTLLETSCKRLSGTGGEMNSVVRLDTQFGGGKTHSLIALVHAVRGMKGVANPAEFIDPKLLPKGEVSVAALDGENSDPANGLRLEGNLLARSLWGEMAYRLAGRDGFERIRNSDEKHVAPGTDTIIELFGDKPTLILIDEVAIYLRKVAKVFPSSVDQFSAFIQALLKAVAATPRACLVFTLAVRADDKAAKDAYKAEQQMAMAAFEEAESVVGRKATQLNPTEEDETVAVLQRRLFERVDLNGADGVVADYVALWDHNKETLHADAFNAEAREQFRRGYPLHPETLHTLIEKTSSLSLFHRTRGMLRLLARAVHQLWKERPADAFAIHPHHLDPGVHSIRDEITTRLGQGQYTPALAADVASVPGAQPGIAQQLDRDHYPGQPPVTSYLARTIFLHTLAFPESAQGIAADRLRYSVCSPAVEPSFAEAARKRFVSESLYLDDRPGAPLRFLTEPNLTQMIRKAVNEVDPGEARSYLNEKIRTLFAGRGHDFDMVPFPAGPYEVPDDIGDGRPYLIVLGYDAFTVSDEPTSLPSEIVRMATLKGANEELRGLRNNLIFVVADERLREDMKQATKRRLALQELRKPERISNLADHQQRTVNEEFEKSSFTIAVAIMQCYRHLFYPSHIALGSGAAKLAHTAIEVANASDSPGNGQVHIKRTLREQKKLLASGDSPDAPTYVRDQTPLKTKGHISTLELRNEFRKAEKLSILLDDDPLIRCIRDGIDSDVFIYRKDELIWGKGDPAPSIEISENAFVHTLADAEKAGLWPRTPRLTGGRAGGEPGGRGTGVGGGADGGGPSIGAEGGGGGVGRAGPIATLALTAEGPLSQALTELFEKARAQKVAAVTELRIKLFEAKATWNVHQAVANYRDADVNCRFEATLSGDEIESFQVEFAGSLNKANAVKSFLDAQLRTTSDHRFEGQYTLRFKEPMRTAVEKAELFTKAMTKYGSGEAFVEAQAAAEGA